MRRLDSYSTRHLTRLLAAGRDPRIEAILEDRERWLNEWGRLGMRLRRTRRPERRALLERRMTELAIRMNPHLR